MCQVCCAVQTAFLKILNGHDAIWKLFYRGLHRRFQLANSWRVLVRCLTRGFPHSFSEGGSYCVQWRHVASFSQLKSVGARPSLEQTLWERPISSQAAQFIQISHHIDLRFIQIQDFSPLLRTVPSVPVDFHLTLILYCVLRRIWHLHDSFTSIHTRSPFQWVCSDMRLAWGQCWSLVSIQAPFARSLHGQFSHEAWFLFADSYFLLVYDVCLHCQFFPSFRSWSRIHFRGPVPKRIHIWLWGTTGFFEKFVNHIRNGTFFKRHIYLA